MLLVTALAPLITGCSTDVYCSKQTGSSSTKGNHHPSFLRFWKARKFKPMQLKFVAAENVVKTETQQTFVNGLLGFITLGIYTRWKRVCIFHTPEGVAHRYGHPSALLINILSGFLPAVFGSISLLSEGEIIRSVLASSQSGRLHYPRRRRYFTQSTL